MLNSIATVSDLVGTLQASFTFDAPVPTHVAATNGPARAGASVTVNGMNFGALGFMASVQIGGSNCATTAWNSASSLVCQTPHGHSGPHRANVVLGGVHGSATVAFSYDAPVLTAYAQPNAPTSGQASVTLSGLNFAMSDVTNVVVVGETQCATASWSTDTSVKCLIKAGAGKSLAVAMAVGATVGTWAHSFSYDAPAISQLARFNAPATSGTQLSLRGFNFGTSNLSPIARLGMTACASTQYVSDTQVTCTSNSGTGVMLEASVETAAVVGLAEAAFSYDSPVLTRAFPRNAPTTSGVWVTVHGSNFGSSDKTATLSVGTTDCGTTSWSTTTAVKCYTADGTGASRALALTTSGNSGTLDKIFSFDRPVITATDSMNAPASGGAALTIFGTNFGNADVSATVSVGGTKCSATVWISPTQMVCTAPAGRGAARSVVATVSSPVSDVNTNSTVDYVAQVSSTFLAFSYDSPVVTSLSPANSAVAGRGVVTVTGTNFGTADNVAVPVFLGVTRCSTTTWLTGTAVTCTVAVGTGARLEATVVVEGLQGSTPMMYSYDAPVVTRVTFVNAPTTTGVSITVFGKNFGPEALPAQPVVKIGGTSCPETVWVSGTSVVCRAPTFGAGAKRVVNVELDSLTSTLASSFSYDTPVVTNLKWADEPHNMTYSVTIQGTNFGGADETVTGEIAEGYCQTSSWSTATSITCKTIAGAGRNLVTVDVAGLQGTRQQLFLSDVSCPNNCNGDPCVDGQCMCKAGWTGRDCSLSYCDGNTTTLSDLTGTFQDHREATYWYQPWYRANECAWLLQPSGAGQVTLEFLAINSKVNQDILKVYDGPIADDDKLLAAVMGSLAVPPPVRSTGGAMLVVWSAPVDERFTGFKALYTSSSCPRDCMSHVGQGTCGANSQCTCNEGWLGEDCAEGFALLDDTFTPVVGDKWLSTPGAVFQFGCSSRGLNALYFGALPGSRAAITRQLDFTYGGTVSFYIRVGNQEGVAAGTGCEMVESGEEVVLDFSVDAGETFVEMGRYGPTAQHNMRFVEVQVPDVARLPEVILRWHQPVHDDNSDNWGLDDVKITAPFVCPRQDGLQCSDRGTCAEPNKCLCESGFHGPACEYACFVDYWSDFQCGCVADFDPYAQI